MSKNVTKDESVESLGTALAKKKVDFAALLEAKGMTLSDLPDDFQGSLKPALLKIPIAHSAGLFEFPDGSQKGVIEGIVITYSTPNAYWESQESEVPECLSLNGLKPDTTRIENPFNHDCPTCQYNQFGSAENGKGKRCSNKVRVFLLMEGNEIPYMVSLSAKSIKPWSEYITHLKNENERFFAVVTRLELERVDTGKHKYSIAHPQKISFFDYYDNDEEKISAKISKVLELIKTGEEMKKTEITRDEAGSDEGFESDPY